MVDTRMQVRGHNPAQPEQPPRDHRRQRRIQVLKDARPDNATVRVVPADEKYRAVLKHQPSGIAFRSQGGATWPNDRFTQRRLRDGSVKLEPEKKAEGKPEAPKQEAPKPEAPRSTSTTPSSTTPSTSVPSA